MARSNGLTSPMLVTTEGDYISMTDVISVRRFPYKDEDGLVFTLKDPSAHSPGTVLWVKTNKEIHVILLSELFNLTSLGVNPNSYIDFHDPSLDQMAEHALVDSWHIIITEGKIK